MSNSFQERFKGKTVLMTKEGVDGVIKDSDNPIPKAGGAVPFRMDDFTSHQRQINSKKEAQTFDNPRSFQHNQHQQQQQQQTSANIYSITYGKPNGNHGGFMSGSSSNKNLDSIDQQMEQLKAAQLIQQQMQMQMQMKQQQQQQQQQMQQMSSKKHHPPVSATEFNRLSHQSIQSTPYKQQQQQQQQFRNNNIPVYQSSSSNKQLNFIPDSSSAQDPLRSLISNTVPVSLYVNNSNQNSNIAYPNYQAGSTSTTATSITGRTSNSNNNKAQPRSYTNNMIPSASLNTSEYASKQLNPFNPSNPANSYQLMMMAGGMQESKSSLEDAYQLKQQNYPQQTNESSKNLLYKPYTLNEYKNLQKGQNYKVGGLGPNIGNDDWSMKKEQADKRIEFAKNIQSINSQVLRNQQEQGRIAIDKQIKELSTREKAIEFAKNIPKPSLIPSSSKLQQFEPMDAKQTTLQQRSSSHAPLSRPARDIDSEEFLKASSKQQHPDIEELEKHHLDFLNQIEKISK